MPDGYDDDPSKFPNWSYFWCPGMYETIETNPLEFTIKNITSVFNLNDIKRLLIEKNRALGIGTPLPNMRYWVPCSDETVSDEPECKNQVYRCPAHSGIAEKYCYPKDIDGRQRDGVFLANYDPNYVSEMGGHAMNLVGYNDDWIFRNRFMTSSSMADLKGGLILHNSWRSQGHSIEYLMGEQSEENENVICPNHMVPLTWIPATQECVEGHINTDFDACVTGDNEYVLPIRGHGRATRPDVLKCASTGDAALAVRCDEKKRYVISRRGDEPAVTEVPGGLNDVEIVMFDYTLDEQGREVYSNFETVHRRDFPFWALSKVFQPVDMVPNDELQCGYWMLPYTTYDRMRRINYDLMDNFRVTDIEVEFAPHSYANSSYSGKYDCKALKDSTHKFTKTSFDGPLPFEYVY